MIHRPKWLGGYFGSNLGLLNYEVLTIQNVARADLRHEAGLYEKKWFDYRRLHPLQASYYFVHCYTQAYRDFCRKAVDATRAPYVRAFKELDFLETSKEAGTTWRLRQKVDSLGLPYGMFFGTAINWYHRMSDASGKVYPPRPGHLLNNDELFADVILAWEERQQVSLQTACDPYYRVSNFKGSRDQLAHEAFVVSQIKTRKHPQFALNRALYGLDVIRLEEALRVFGHDLVSQAISGQSVA